ncbi:hypothetical protein PIROE2DRAFT_56833 [Piromyces sp. E2]|nr:hypothetical protein PIROE2DRAFT_56833 [Piromyces sp. E2]|eukprot:OUM70326.1 hypothetical protein PIROE2DRAFT_56833 [Piromyces sp. E2]
MSAINFKKVCENHNKQICVVCLNKGCSNRFLCKDCFRCHDTSHSINYVPLDELKNGNNKIILFNEYIEAKSEEANKLMKKKQEFLNEMYAIMEESKKFFEKKINEQFDKFNPLGGDLQKVDSLSLDEISNIYENIKNDDKKIIPVKYFGELLKSRLTEVAETCNFGLQNQSYKSRFTQKKAFSTSELERMKAKFVQASATMQMQKIEIAKLIEKKQNLKSENERLQKELRRKTLVQKPAVQKRILPPLPVYAFKIEQVTNAQVSRLALQERLTALNRHDPNKANEKFREINRKWLTNDNKWTCNPRIRSSINNIIGYCAPWCLPEFREELETIESLIQRKREDMARDN